MLTANLCLIASIMLRFVLWTLLYLTTNLSAKYYSSKEVTCVPYLTDNVGVAVDVANCQT